MNEMSETEYLDIMNQKEYHFVQIYDITCNILLTGKDEEIIHYVLAIEERETHFSCLKELDKLTAPFDESYGTNKEVLPIKNRIRKLSEDILNLDRSNEGKAKQALDNLKKNLRGISKGKNINKLYSSYIPVSDGVYFDRKN